MATSWNGQINPETYRIQFETTNKELYKIVEKACQTAMDVENRHKEYIKAPRVDRFYNWENEFRNG